MNYIRSMNKSQLLLPLMAISIALMAFAFWAATNNKVEAQNSGYMGIMSDDLTLISTGDTETSGADNWTKILSGEIRTPQWEDTVFGVSLECGLYTDTKVRSKGGDKDASKAEAMVRVKVMVDGVEMAAPGEVRFCARSQELIAQFGGVLDCVDTNGDDVINYSECDLTEEELQLIIQTVGAHHFNFVKLDFESGDHFIEVKAELTTNAEWQAGSAEAKAFIGKGSLIVDEVRLAKTADLSSN